MQVANTSPLAGMVISPKQGVVPIGGTTEIKVSCQLRFNCNNIYCRLFYSCKSSCFSKVEFTPDLVHKFDSEIQVNILGWKTIKLRLGGTVEQPCVDVDVVS